MTDPGRSRTIGIGAALLSSALGGSAIVATRSLSAELTPVLIGLLRFGIGCVILLPLALLEHRPWPKGRQLLPVAGLGLLFFTVFPLLFNASLDFTSAARGSLVLSTLPLITLLGGSLLGVEAFTRRKIAGVLIAIAGVALTLVLGLGAAPEGAWRGDLLMLAAATCMALYTIWSRPYISATGPLTFTATAMLFGAGGLAIIAGATGQLAAVAALGAPEWLASGYLGLFGAAITFSLWAVALGRVSPTIVAVSVTVNPIVATLAGSLFLGERLQPVFAIGIVGIAVGVGVTARAPRPAPAQGAGRW